jgi:hypothetical protein
VRKIPAADKRSAFGSGASRIVVHAAVVLEKSAKPGSFGNRGDLELFHCSGNAEGVVGIACQRLDPFGVHNYFVDASERQVSDNRIRPTMVL